MLSAVDAAQRAIDEMVCGGTPRLAIWDDCPDAKRVGRQPVCREAIQVGEAAHGCGHHVPCDEAPIAADEQGAIGGVGRRAGRGGHVLLQGRGRGSCGRRRCPGSTSTGRRWCGPTWRCERGCPPP